MGGVLLVTSEMAGRIHMMCELARRLSAAGHAAVVTSPVDIRDRVEAQEVRYVPLSTAEPVPADAEGSPRERGLARRAAAFVRRLGEVRTIDARQRRKVAALRLDEWSALLAAEAPDLALIDIELPAHIMTARGAGVPVIVWTSMLSLWKRPGLPPLGSAVVPGRGWQGSPLGIEWIWLRFRLGQWLRRQRLRITRVGEDQISVLRRVAHESGFPFRKETDLSQWLVPFTYRTLPTATFNARELEFPHEPPPHLTYVGPLVSQHGRPHPQLDGALRPLLDEVYERRRAGQSDALIYCSFGAWHKGDDRDFLRRVLDAVADRPDWDVVIGLGSRLDPSDLGPIPGNAHPLRWAPQLEILAQADCAIHHGGISTINECIAHGVPMVLYPFDFMDQPGNAARVRYHGIGDVGDRDQDSAAAIRQRIERLLADPDVAVRLAALGQAMAAHDASGTAVAYIERALATGGDHHS